MGDIQHVPPSHGPTIRSARDHVRLLVLGMAGAAVIGAAIGAVDLVRRGLVKEFLAAGDRYRLVWIAAGAAAGTVGVLIWRRVKREKIKLKAGYLLGGAVGAIVAAPSAILAASLPTAGVFAGLLAACWLLFLAVGLHRMSASSQLLRCAAAGTLFGAVCGAALRLSFTALNAAAKAGHGNIGQAFGECLEDIAKDAAGWGTVILVGAGGLLGLALTWRSHWEMRADAKRDRKGGPSCEATEDQKASRA
jgi:hypothetical protein